MWVVDNGRQKQIIVKNHKTNKFHNIPLEYYRKNGTKYAKKQVGREENRFTLPG